MDGLVGKWGYLNDAKFVAPSQRDYFAKKNLLGATMRCIGVNESGQPILSFKGDVFVVDSAGFHVRPAPAFSWGDRVRVTSKGVVASVIEVCWHYTEQRYFYHVKTEDGKRLKKRYFSEDLEEVRP